MAQQLTDDAILEQMKPMRVKANLLKYGGFALMAASAVFFIVSIIDMATARILLGMAAFVVGLTVFRTQKKYNEQFKSLTNEILVPAVLEEFFDASEYKRDDFTGSHLKAMGIAGMWDTGSFNDHCKVSYKGVNISFCDAHLKRREEETDSESPGGTSTSLQTVIKGHMLIFDFGGKLPENLQALKSGGKKRIDTKEKARWVYLQFVDGELHMAVHNKRDFFDPDVTKITDINALREKYREEMRYLTGLIDEVLRSNIL